MKWARTFSDKSVVTVSSSCGALTFARYADITALLFCLRFAPFARLKSIIIVLFFPDPEVVQPLTRLLGSKSPDKWAWSCLRIIKIPGFVSGYTRIIVLMLVTYTCRKRVEMLLTHWWWTNFWTCLFVNAKECTLLMNESTMWFGFRKIGRWLAIGQVSIHGGTGQEKQ